MMGFNQPIEDPFRDIIAAQAELERSLKRIVPREVTLYNYGVYQPTYLGSATPGTTTYSTQDGYWRRYNDVILFHGRVTWTAVTGTGNAQISLPFTTATAVSGTYRWGGDLWTSSVTIGTFSPQMLITQNNAFFTMWQPANNAGAAVIAMEAAGDVIFSGFFEITP